MDTTLARTRADGPGRIRGTATRRRAFWLVVRPARGRLEIMPARLPGRGLAVGVFSFEEEARMFLRPAGPAGDADGEHGWRVRQTHPGELSSLLLGPCRRAERVALDPLPGAAPAPVNALASMGCRDFLDFVLGDRAARRRARKRAAV